MSLCTLLREDSHFLVMYISDNTLQVRSKKFIQCEGEVVLNSQYPVKHGLRSNDIATATVLGSGTEGQMNQLLLEKEQELDQHATEQPRKKQRVAKTVTVTKKKASVIKRTNLPPSVIQYRNTTEQPDPLPQSPEPQSPTHTAVPEQPTHTAVPEQPTHTPVPNPPTHTAVPQQPTHTPVPHPPTHTAVPQPPPHTAVPQQSTHPPVLHPPTHTAVPQQPTHTPVPQQPTHTPVPLPYLQLPQTQPDSPFNYTHQQSAFSPFRPQATHSQHFIYPDIPPSPQQQTRNDNMIQRIAALESSNATLIANQKSMMSMLAQLLSLHQSSKTSTPATSYYQQQHHDPTTETYPFMDVPEHLRISMTDLNGIAKQSNCPGHFATKILEKLFPELFTSDNLRLQYSYYGGGKLNKIELQPERKNIMMRYILFFYPHLSDSRAWKDAIVPRVNEYLRRAVKAPTLTPL